MTRTLTSQILIGLAAAAGALGAAAMMSVTAPTARADDFTDVINAVDGDFAQGQVYFGEAVTAFGSNADVTGLADLFNGLNEDVLGSSTNLFAGTAELLDNEVVTGPVGLGITAPTDFASGASLAEDFYQAGLSYLTDGASAFAAGDYGYGVFDDLFGANILAALPLEEILLGSVASL
jgi:hypothetical protein